MRAAWRLPAKEGMVRLEKQAEWLDQEYPSAATSLREGLAEMFTVNRLDLSPALSRCLVSINIIESPHSGVRLRTRRICRWRDGKMVLRWAAATLLMTEQGFRKMIGYRDLWMNESSRHSPPTNSGTRSGRWAKETTGLYYIRTDNPHLCMAMCFCRAVVRLEFIDKRKRCIG
jgi:putative transposase